MDVMNRPRKAWLAGLLTFITIGLGHIYAGKAKRGLFFYFALQMVCYAPVFAIFLFAPGRVGLASASALFLGVHVFSIYDAMVEAKKGSDTYQPQKYNRWYIYLGCWFVSGLMIQPVVGASIKYFLVQSYKMPSGSMMPAVKVGDYFFAKKELFVSTIDRGDILVFPYPKDPSKDFIKRVVGLGGESVEIKDKQVYINGNPLDEPYTIFVDREILPSRFQPRDNFGPVTIPEGALFVMGDNRDESNDSRYFGFIQASEVKGKAYSIYWSWDKNDFGVRWERIGTRIE